MMCGLDDSRLPEKLQDRCSRLGLSLVGDPVPGCLEFDHRRMLRLAIKEGLEERCADPADVEHRHPHMTALRRSRGAVLPELYRTLPVSIGHSATPRAYRSVILVKRFLIRNDRTASGEANAATIDALSRKRHSQIAMVPFWTKVGKKADAIQPVSRPGPDHQQLTGRE